MKKLLYASLIFGAMLAGNISYGKDNLWKSYKGMYAPSSMEMIVKPNAYSIFTLDNASMKHYLADVSADFSTGKTISIPTPNGDYKTFRIWKNTAMAPELAAKYPEIQTFDGVDVNNPLITAKFGFNMFGFSAYVIDGANTYIIDPYSNAGDGYYMAFYKNELPAEHIMCGVDEMMRATGIQDLDNGPESFNFNTRSGDAPPPPYAHSTQQRKFRAAITNTGEWAVAIVGSSSPTKAQVLAKITEIVNRINSYFEREIAVTLELIPNNDVLVFTNKDTDPYNYNSQMPNLLGESHESIVNRVGANNFDIGHILCTAGGGLAATPAVCSNNSKGRAASTVGSTSQVKVIMHEMGHQMNASHTFSSDRGGCNGNGMPQGAYESGSGVTIMSYNGACAGDNVPSAQDDYYHVHSLYEITNHINNNISCGTLSTNIPVLSIPNILDTYYIPLNTPFELVGPEATVQGSQIKQTFLYNWEQYDNGFDFEEAQGSSQTTGPTLRSHDPKTSTIQAFPPPSIIISGTYNTAGYRLPSVARVLNFKYIARGVVNGRGAFHFTDSTLKVISVTGTGPFRVTSQNSGTANWNPGDNVEIKWDVANTNSAPINCQGVSIFMCFPNSTEPDILLVGYAPNTGSYVYPVQNFYARNGHIKVKGAGNIFFDVAKGAINVNGTSIDETTFSKNITVYPNPATEHINIKNDNNYVKLNVVMYNVMGQKVWEGEMTNTLTIPTAGMASGNYQIQLQDPATQNVATHKVSIVK